MVFNWKLNITWGSVVFPSQSPGWFPRVLKSLFVQTEAPQRTKRGQLLLCYCFHSCLLVLCAGVSRCVATPMLWRVCVWRAQDIQQPILFFHHVGSRNQPQVLRLRGEHFYLLGHLTCPEWCLEKKQIWRSMWVRPLCTKDEDKK